MVESSPLTPLAFEILLALCAGERHGYAILQDIEDRAPALRLRPGSLYRALHRLVEDGLVVESAATKVSARDGLRRRYFRLTALGRRAAEAELQRLTAQIRTARRRLFVELSSV